jgi:hypothetical protein
MLCLLSGLFSNHPCLFFQLVVKHQVSEVTPSFEIFEIDSVCLRRKSKAVTTEEVSSDGLSLASLYHHTCFLHTSATEVLLYFTGRSPLINL